MNILLLGSGGREHAIAWALAKSKRCDRLFVAPGNGGTESLATNLSGIDITDGQAVLDAARAHDIDMVVVGPEVPLVAGVADALRDAGVLVFGPDKQNAQLEGSKSYAKSFMREHGLPTAEGKTFTDEDTAVQYVRDMGAPIVVKADGLAAGKGVVVAQTTQEAVDAVRSCFEGAFGNAGYRVVIEECLTGPECSLLAFLTGGKAFCMTTAQDHKRALDGDQGLNTGGMGVYSPVPIVREDELEKMKQIMADAAQATSEPPFEHDFRGVLYGGFMLTPKGPKLLEFNVRFGDPETQVILPRLKTDLVDVMEAVAKGRPQDIHLQWSDKWAVCVVLTSKGYPEKYQTGKVIRGLDTVGAMDDVLVFHAGTTHNPQGELVTDGGRVLDVVGLGSTFDEARQLAYKACETIDFEGKTYRHDIGAKAAAGRDSWK